MWRGRLRSCLRPSLTMPVGLVEQLVLHEAAWLDKIYFHWKSQEQTLLTHYFISFIQKPCLPKSGGCDSSALLSSSFVNQSKRWYISVPTFYSPSHDYSGPSMTFILLLCKYFASIYKPNDIRILSWQREPQQWFCFLPLSADSSLETSQPRVNLASCELHNLQATAQESSQLFLSVWVNAKFTTRQRKERSNRVDVTKLDSLGLLWGCLDALERIGSICTTAFLLLQPVWWS